MPLQDSSKRASPHDLLTRAAEAADGQPGVYAHTQRAAAHPLTGDHRQRRAGSGERFWQFREYDSSDSTQAIDWRQSAKRQRLYVRQQEWETPQRSLFWVDDNPGMTFTSDPKTLPSKGDFARIIALGLGMLLTRNGEHVGGLLPGVTTGHSTDTLHQLADHFLHQDQHSDPATMMDTLAAHQLPRHATPVIFSDCLQTPATLGEQLDTLTARMGAGLLVQVLDPAEMDLPYRGRIVFKSPAADTQTAFHVPEAEEIAHQYRERITEHCRTVGESANTRGWLYLRLRTDTDPAQALTNIWGEIDIRRKATN